MLTSKGEIQKYSLIKVIDTKTDEAFVIKFTPTQDGYIYISEYDKAPVKCLSRLYK